MGGYNVERRSEKHKRIMLLLTKPSYTLQWCSFKNTRHEHRIKLRNLLRNLVRQQNWVEASGVLSTLIKATCKEGSVQNNRTKYWVAMELLRHVEGETAAYSKGIECLYNIWMGKIQSWKNKPLKDKFSRLESILSRIAHNTTILPREVPAVARVPGVQEIPRLTLHELRRSKGLRDACEDARSLKLEHGSASDPVSNLVIGLAFYQDWYSTLPKEMRLKNLDDSCMSMESVTNNKGAQCNFSQYLTGQAFRAKINMLVGHHQHIQTQGFHANSSETSAENDQFVDDHYDKWQFPSVFNVHGLGSLLPIMIPSSDNMVDHLSSYQRSLLDGTYKTALEHLCLAFKSGPPVSEAALVPLIQLLLLGDHPKLALTVLEKYCSQSNSILPFRLRAHLWECFQANDSYKLPAYLEDVLKKDPSCRYSLGRLISLNKKGVYALERLVEMIALHLEATYPDYSTWKEFASCLLKLSWYEEDRASMCETDSGPSEVSLHGIPYMFVRGISGKTWKLRCKWWLNRHFSKVMLASELSTGDLQLMTYKAACASYLYGEEMDYVAKVHAYLKQHDKALFTTLYLHVQNSIGFLSTFVRK